LGGSGGDGGNELMQEKRPLTGRSRECSCTFKFGDKGTTYTGHRLHLEDCLLLPPRIEKGIAHVVVDRELVLIHIVSANSYQNFFSGCGVRGELWRGECLSLMEIWSLFWLPRKRSLFK